MPRRLIVPLSVYALLLLGLSLWTLPALEHIVTVSRNRPTLFGPTLSGHIDSGYVWVAFEVAIWGAWLWCMRRAQGLPLRIAVAVAIGLGLLMVPFAWRATSNDPMEYLLWGLAQAHFHLNPLHATLRTAHWPFAVQQSAWVQHPDPYGPMFWVIERILGVFSMSWFTWVWRAICVLAYALTAASLGKFLARRGTEDAGRWLLAIWASPIVLIETVAGAHNDTLVALFLILALVLWQSPRSVKYGALAFGLSIAIKPLFLLSAPAVLLWFWRRHGVRAALWQVALAAIAVLVWFIPYGSPILYVTQNLAQQGGLVGYGLAIVLRWLSVSPSLVRIAGLALVIWAWIRGSRGDLVAATGLPLLVSQAAFTTWIEPWYFVSLQPVIWLTLSPRWRVIVIALEAEFLGAYGITMAFGWKPLLVSCYLTLTLVVLWIATVIRAHRRTLPPA